MSNLQEMHPEYITDENGRRKSVVLPIEEFEKLLEELTDLAAVAERRNEPTVSQQELIEQLKKDGLI